MIADLYTRLSAVTGPYVASMAEASEQGEAFAEANEASMESVEATNGEGAASFGLIGKAAAALSVAFVAASAISLKWATGFQSATTLLYTQAGLTTQQLAAAGYSSSSLQSKLLSLGDQYGFTGTQMAEALYHPISAGLDLASALNVVQDSAQEAQVSGADLTDTTYTLSTVMKAFNYPASQAAQTMATLNAVVGNGDTTFQDLNDSVKTWAPTANAFGVSLTSIGAALDYMTDRGDSATTAGTHVAMMMAMMVGQTKQAAGLMTTLGLDSTQVTAANSAMAEALQKSGITTTRLAADLQEPDGLYVALNDLQTSMTNAGVTGTEASDLLVKAFGGGKSFKSVAESMANLGGLQQKFQQLSTQGTVSQWDADWAQASSTMKVQLDKIGAAVQNAGISFGMYLLPKAQQFLTLITTDAPKAFSILGKGLSQITQGYNGTAGVAPTAPAPVDLHAAGLNRMEQTAALPAPPLTAWQQFGQVIHTLVTDLASFGRDAETAFVTLIKASKPVVGVFGKALMGALLIVGGVLKNDVGPALVKFADFLQQHQGLVKFFAEVIVGGLIAKLTVLSTLKAATGILSLANSIIRFPLSSVSGIGTALKGVGGAASTLWSTVSTIGSGIGKFAGSVGSGLSTVGSSVGKIFSLYGKGMSALGGVTKTGLTAAGSALKSGLSGMANIAGQQITYIRGMFSKIMPTKLDFQIMLKSVKDAGSKVATAISGWAGGIAGSAKTAFSSMAKGLSTLGTNALTAAKSFGTSAWSGITGMLASVGGAIAKAATATWGWVTSAAAAAVEAGQAALAWTADKIALMASAIAEGAATAGQWLLDAAMDANPIGAIILAIMALVGIFVLLWTKCGWFRAFWKGLWADIKMIVGDAVSWAKQHLVLLASIILFPLAPLILLWKHWGQITSDLKKWTADAVDWVKSHLMLVVNVVLGPLIGAITYLATHWSQIWSDIKKDAGAAWSWLDGNVFKPVKGFFDTVIVGSLDAAKREWDSVWGGFKSTVATIWAYLKPVFDTIGGAITKITGALSKVSGVAGSIGGGVGKAFSAITGFDNGGFVPGAKGSPTLAIVHGGEYVVSNAMLSGNAPVDNRALSGALAAGSGGGSGGALAVQPGGGTTTVYVTNVNVNCGPQLSTSAAVQDAVQTAMGQLGMRNVQSYTPYSAARARSS